MIESFRVFNILITKKIIWFKYFYNESSGGVIGMDGKSYWFRKWHIRDIKSHLGCQVKL